MPMSASSTGKRNAVSTAPILAKAAAKPAPLPRIARREDLAGQQVGLRVGADVGHEVEQHEAAEQQRCVRAGSAACSDSAREPQARGAADEADDLQADAADPVGQQHRGQDADDQQHVEQRRALGGQDVAARSGR